MTAALPKSVARRVRELDDLKLKNQVRREMRTILLAHMIQHERRFRDLSAYYGQNLPFSTAPESAAEALFHFGLEAGILTEHNRPAFVRTWRREPS